MTGSRARSRGGGRTLSAAAFAPLALGPFWKPPSHCGERGASAGGRSGETRGGVVSGEALGSGVEGRWTIVASRIRTIAKMEGGAPGAVPPPGRRDKLASALVAPLVMAPVGLGWASRKRLRSADAPAFGDARATRRASGRAKRGITRESRAKESAPLVSIGSRTSGTVRTRHADYVSRGVCFSRGRLSADPGIKISRHSRRMRGARGVPRANQGRGHGRNGSIADRKPRRSRALDLRKAARRGAVRLEWTLFVLDTAPFHTLSSSTPNENARAPRVRPTADAEKFGRRGSEAAARPHTRARGSRPRRRVPPERTRHSLGRRHESHRAREPEAFPEPADR